TLDATVPVMVKRQANTDDFAARDLVLARGAMHVAAGESGSERVELTELVVSSHQPVAAEKDVTTDLARISIELSAVLSPTTDLSQYLRVFKGGVLADGQGNYALGEEITQSFQFGFGQRNGEPAFRFLELIPTQELQADTEYVVVVSQGLAPLTGNPLARDYVYSFFTSVAGAARAPEIVSIEPNTGSIEGGTEVVIRGRHFGEQPTVFVGGQPVVVDEVLPADGADSLERIRFTTMSHYAGPAAVQVSNPLGLSATVIGGFTYVDLLQISFVTPAVIRVQQAGENDAVEIVGYGFHDGLSLKAYPSGQIEQAVTQKVGAGSLKL